jgi:hypothetical protein
MNRVQARDGSFRGAACDRTGASTDVAMLGGLTNKYTFTRESPVGFRQYRPISLGWGRRREARPYGLVYTVP